MRRLLQKALLLAALVALTPATVGAQATIPKKGPSKAAIYTSLPSGYSRVGTTLLYQKTSSVGIDVIGQFGTRYYSSTFADAGYRLAMKVGTNSAVIVSGLAAGTTANGVKATQSIVQQGTMALLVYTFRNTNSSAVTISAGIHADVMIGNNDLAPLSRRLTPAGKVYGMTMKNGDGSQLCALFGGDMTGVSAADDYWFGYYGQNNNATAMVGNYSQGQNWMVENGSYDSGMGWCWKNRTIAAGGTLTLSWLLCVGEVNLEPKATYSLTTLTTNLWNDVAAPHPFRVEGNYESPAGLDGYIEFSTDGSDLWQRANTQAIASGSNYNITFNATFDPDASTHSLRLRLRDAVGNVSELDHRSWDDPSYYDLSGIEDKVYDGTAHLQTHLQAAGRQGQTWAVERYTNNVHAGEATFDIVGVYPTTMGRRTYTFNIAAAPLPTSITLSPSAPVYTGSELRPAVRFGGSLTLVEGRDYTLTWSNNVEPGTATVTITGMGDFAGERTLTFTIAKMPVTPSLYDVTLPTGNIDYDGLPHGAEVAVADGVGQPTLSYYNRRTGAWSYDQPVEPGDYDVYLEIAAGNYFAAMTRTLVGRITIVATILPGDANDDGNVDILDAQWTLRYILAPGETTPFNFENANTYDSDQTINVQDIVCTVNILMGMPVVNTVVFFAPARVAPADAAMGLIAASADAVRITAPAGTAVAAIDLLLADITPEQLSLALPPADYMMATRQTDEGTRVVVLSTTGRSLAEAGTEVTLLHTSTLAHPTAAQAATPLAEPAAMRIAAATDGIYTPPATDAPRRGATGGHTLSGQRLAQPRRGINIIGGRKVVIK